MPSNPSVVAVGAEQASNFPGYMVVVDSQPNGERSFGSSTDAAGIVLFNEQGVVLFYGDTVLQS